MPARKFGCVMAQYHYQHELPETTLAKAGIIGTFLATEQGIRFMSGLEVTFLHGLVRPYYLPQMDGRSSGVVGVVELPPGCQGSLL